MTRFVYLTDGVETFSLDESNGMVMQKFSSGWPSIRRRRDRRPGQSGSSDQTEFFDERTLLATVGIAGELVDATDDIVIERLSAWMRPDLRYWLIFGNTEDPTSPRRFAVRPGRNLSQLDLARTSNFTLPVLQWVAYEGVSESLDPVIETVSFSASSELGRDYDIDYDISFPASGVIGTKPVINEGNASAWPLLRIFGPATGAEVENDRTGVKVKFQDAFEITAGQRVDIDMKEGTVLLNGDPLNNRYFKLDFPNHDWWQLLPGTNLIRFNAVSTSEPAYVELTYRHTYI